ncbi:MaoC family dehydratase [Halocatena halophila]|uniref:MaoC family dehydratase n=1 Tax=Halocatena halophila TaxID=2814576 RepID=UPI002ED084FA
MRGEYFEDISVGDTHEFGSYSVEKEEMLSFATQYDPQSFHIDPAAAEESLFGGLVASGLHTAAISQRLVVENVFHDSRAMGAIGGDKLRWNHPVRPGDTLSMTAEVVEKKPNDATHGLIKFEMTTFNQNDIEVMSLILSVIYQIRSDTDEKESK